MKKVVFFIIIAVVIISLIVVGIVFFFKSRSSYGKYIKAPKKPVNTEPLDFQSIRLTKNNGSAILEVYEIEKTENGVKLARIYENISDDERTVVREIEGDKTLLVEIQKKLGKYGVESWDGFKGANPRDILDGYSMSFSCTMADGRKLSASGSNNFPYNYGAVRDYIGDMLRYETLNNTKFAGDCYEITLPESWVSNVKISFDEGYHSFFIPLKERDVFLMRVDFTLCELNDKSKSTDIGKIKLKDSDEELFLSVLNYESYMREDEGTEEQYKIYTSFKEDFKKIVDSIKLADGYEFVETM